MHGNYGVSKIVHKASVWRKHGKHRGLAAIAIIKNNQRQARLRTVGMPIGELLGIRRKKGKMK